MFQAMELGTKNAGEWLSARGLAGAGATFVELGGGVSNKVILAEGLDFRAVIKQSLGRLRVNEEWLSDRGRIFREAAAMRWLSGRVRGGRIPAVLAEDAENYAIAMEAAPQQAEMWKTRLFRGEMDPDDARRAGELLAQVIGASWENDPARELFGDQRVFEQLRIDPYYRFTAARRPEAAGYVERLITASRARRVSVVHGDWSPKNLLVGGAELWAIDWEVVHFGDPAFDVAFLWNHLLMKSIAMPEFKRELGSLATAFTQALRAGLPGGAEWIPGAAMDHLPALLLARVDGKSPAEYLDEAMRDRARGMALRLMREPARSIEEIFESR